MKNHTISLVSALLTAKVTMAQSTPVASSASTTSTAFAWSTYPAEDLCSTTTTFLALATPWANPEETSSKMNSKYITEEITGAITTAGELVVVATLTAVNGWGEPANGYYVFFESYLKSENFDIITSTETQTSMCSHSLAPSPTGKGECTPHEDHWHCDGAAAEA
ncbi:hypothetical protein NW768_010265 [Fusarium equiseti]|uniref:Uncharacterized protein n=1 Tax=Fusarium equiseti TaxID=61235 RepID=A0ABQ8R1D6_FUSEQ|nr:hypothetical protein NW768_010265 [Fusarium equiseti]